MNHSAIIVFVGISFLAISPSVRAKEVGECPKFEKKYNSCQKVKGILPKFFESVAIQRKNKSFVLTTQTVQGPLTTTYTPDRIVRLGVDHHFLPDGKMLENLPSHESSFCRKGTLLISEVTFLPDNSVVVEEASLRVEEDGSLRFDVRVEGKDLLIATCTRN